MSYAVDPEYRPMMGFLPELDVADAEKARAVIRSMRTEDPMTAVPAGVAVHHRTAPAADGSDIGLVVFEPEERTAQPLPCVVYFHGGGFVFGDATTDVRVPSASPRAWTRWWSPSTIDSLRNTPSPHRSTTPSTP